MKNVIKYYYNLNIEDIHQNNNIYKFKSNGITYIITKCEREYEEIIEIYNLHLHLKTIGFYCHEIILNKDNEIITNINGNPYVLMKLRIINRKININDIRIISNIPINYEKYKRIKRNNWYNLWIKKIDYIEYQISQFKNKYPIIRESIDYYIGLVENCIMMLSGQTSQKTITTLSHNRINKNTTTDEFYNPLNFILDIRVRDIGEYIKSYILEDNNIEKDIQEYVYEQKLAEEEIKNLLVRVIYPSNYIDTCEKILDKKMQEKELLKIINKNEIYEKNIKKIYNTLKRIKTIPEIEWLNINI